MTKEEKENLIDHLQTYGYIDWLPEASRADKDIIRAAMDVNFRHFYEIDPKLKNDKNFVLKSIDKGYPILGCLSDELRADKEVVLHSVSRREPRHLSEYCRDCQSGMGCGFCRGRLIRFASPELQSDREVALAALADSLEAFEYVSPELKADRSFIIEMARNEYINNHSSGTYSLLSPELQGDKEFMLELVKNNPLILLHVPNTFSNDKEIVLQAVMTSGRALRFADVELQNDREVLYHALKNEDEDSIGEIFPRLLPEFLDEIGCNRLDFNRDKSTICSAIETFLRGCDVEELNNKLESDLPTKPIKSPMDLRDEQAALSNGATKTKSNKIKI
ncbi:MAG TPA: DUF4116 domain-containing protein [Anaerovoracaceae bacterium]|nr:DUF4116 domain-containing protein [Anaerovoracaceae bacterium]